VTGQQEAGASRRITMHPYFSQALAAEHISDALKAADAVRRAHQVRQTRSSRFAALAAALRGTVPAGQATRVHVRRA
jgi:hypothetical protein